jgi:hypothetical protein
VLLIGDLDANGLLGVLPPFVLAIPWRLVPELPCHRNGYTLEATMKHSHMLAYLANQP